MSKPTIIGTAEAAAILGVVQDHVKHLARSGEIPARKMGKTWLFERSDVEKYQRKPRGNPNFRKKKPAKTLDK